MEDEIVTDDEATILHVLANALAYRPQILRNVFQLSEVKGRIHLMIQMRTIQDTTWAM